MKLYVPPELICEIIMKIDTPEEKLKTAIATRQTHLFKKIIPTIPHMSIHMTTIFGKLTLLQWWYEEFPERFNEITSRMIVINALYHENLNIIEWWMKTFSDDKLVSVFRNYPNIIDSIASRGAVESLDFLFKTFGNIKYTKDAIDNACSNGHVQVVNWFIESKLPILFTPWKVFSKNNINRNALMKIIENNPVFSTNHVKEFENLNKNSLSSGTFETPRDNFYT